MHVLNTVSALTAAPVSEWIQLPQVAANSGEAHVRLVRGHSIEIGRLAVGSLYEELRLYPKPGLVSPFDNGSHDDMDAGTFMRSMFALRHYFIAIAQAGAAAASFVELKQLGIEAEQRMLAATQGINTHRGAIFSLGMLCATVGYCRARSMPCSPQTLRAVLLIQWGEALAAHTSVEAGNSHGQQVAARHSASGAREEVAMGLPSVFEVALPVLQQTLEAGRPMDHARIDALFALMAHISDTNIYYRRGAQGADIVKSAALEFMASGGTARRDWKKRALDCHRLFIRHRLSPGGAADLLAVTCFVHEAGRRIGSSSLAKLA